MKGFSKEQYKDRHPGGKLGAMLLKTKELMAKGDAMPVVSKETKMSDALIVMTEKSLGCVGVTDEQGVLVGIITDGDLRRHMSGDLLSETAGEVMTPNPKTIGAEMLASDGVRIMNEKKITTLFIVDEETKPLGVLHLHRCLQAGVV